RNTARFLLANLNGFDPTEHALPPERMLMLDRWVVERARRLQDDVVKAYESYEFHHIYQKVHNFCANDLGGFYLDVIKDRQYTTQRDSVARRSAQTALYLIAEALVRWLAPILSFTTEEIWRNLPGEHEESVFMETWFLLPEMFLPEDPDAARFGLDYWQDLLAVRDAVAKELEKLRVAGAIGSSLDAEVDLYCDAEWMEKLARIEDELRFVLITSYARVHPLDQQPEDAITAGINGASIGIRVTPSAHGKCVRCWHHREDVGATAEHPELCGRCVSNVAGSGEPRSYA
ncbi:MAG: class I tRNA ligase family protein, partial [Thiogranum sp.]|nr:class I tRNA ligase family protein [Thiogranum sp.]